MHNSLGYGICTFSALHFKEVSARFTSLRKFSREFYDIHCADNYRIEGVVRLEENSAVDGLFMGDGAELGSVEGFFVHFTSIQL